MGKKRSAPTEISAPKKRKLRLSRNKTRYTRNTCKTIKWNLRFYQTHEIVLQANKRITSKKILHAYLLSFVSQNQYIINKIIMQ